MDARMTLSPDIFDQAQADAEYAALIECAPMMRPGQSRKDYEAEMDKHLKDRKAAFERMRPITCSARQLADTGWLNRGKHRRSAA